MNRNENDREKGHVQLETETAHTHPGDAHKYQVRVNTSRRPSGRKRRIDRRMQVLATSPSEAVQAAIGWLVQTHEAAGNATADGTKFHAITIRPRADGRSYDGWEIEASYNVQASNTVAAAPKRTTTIH